MNAKQILLIDDHADLRDILTLRLKASGYEVVQARDGVEALEKIKAQLPDVVISDVQMPEMDGFTLLRELKRICKVGEDARTIPIIMISGVKKGPEIRALFEMEGASAFIEKPLDGKQLVQKIEELTTVK